MVTSAFVLLPFGARRRLWSNGRPDRVWLTLLRAADHDYHLLAGAIEVAARLHTGGLIEIVEGKPIPATYGRLGQTRPRRRGLARARTMAVSPARGVYRPEWDLRSCFTNQWALGQRVPAGADAVYGALRRLTASTNSL
jgi:hypothetical protein